MLPNTEGYGTEIMKHDYITRETLSFKPLYQGYFTSLSCLLPFLDVHGPLFKLVDFMCSFSDDTSYIVHRKKTCISLNIIQQTQVIGT